MIKFGTGGWRAVIGEEFTKRNIMLVSQALADRMHQENAKVPGIVIGYDRRFLSDIAAVWIAQVMAGNGITVYFIDKIAPTPLVMYTVKKLGTRYGAAVTASHNPADYNGIKIFTEGGRDASEEVTAGIEVLISDIGDEKAIRSMEYGQALEVGLIKIVNPFNEYIDAILNMINVEAIKEKNLKILLDPMFGVSKTCLQTILVTARCELDIINDRHDALFGGRLPSPSSATLSRLKDMVVEKHYDLGIGTDGDADRLGIIDENGDFIHPNHILALLYYYFLKYKDWKGGVVRNVATTHLLDRMAENFGERCYEVPVGFKHISEKMEQTDALIGGESSGGLTIRGHIRGKDGIFAASLLVELVCVTGKSLSALLREIYDQFGCFYYEERDFRFDHQERERLMKVLYEDKELPSFKTDVERISDRDGVKVYFKNGGWVIARFSGTEPLLRIIAEMGSREGAAEVCDRMAEFLNLNRALVLK